MILPSQEQISAFDPDLDEFVRFLRAGGTFNLWDWIAMPEPWRVLMLEAGTRVSNLNAASVGAAMTPEGVAELVSPVDGGKMKAAVALNQVAADFERSRS